MDGHFVFVSVFQIAVLISVGFIGSWSPYAAVSLWSVFHPGPSSIPATVALLPCLFAKSSTVFNPLVYYMFSNTFRKEVRNLSWVCWQANAMAEPSNDAPSWAGLSQGPRHEQNGGTELLALRSVSADGKADVYSLTLVNPAHGDGQANTEQ